MILRTLQLPTDPGEALSLLERGRDTHVDIIEMSDADGKRYLLNAATGGFSEQVHEQMDDQMKQRWGVHAYLRAGAASRAAT